MWKFFFVSIELVQIKSYLANYLYDCKKMKNKFEKYKNKNILIAFRE